MKKRYFMGIDVAKATFDFCLLSSSGACLWRGQFSNDARGIARFLAQLPAGSWKLSQIHFALEATGVYGKALIAALHQAGLALSVLNPAQVKYFGFSVLRRTKNDRVDAEIIARFCLERKPLATRPLRPVEEQLKLLVHERESARGCTNRAILESTILIPCYTRYGLEVFELTLRKQVGSGGIGVKKR
jgi:transposase